MTENMIEKRIDSLVEGLMVDYGKEGAINQGSTVSELDKDAIIEILQKLQQIIFPGHFMNRNYRMYTTKNNITMLIEKVLFQLSTQVAIVMEKDEQKAQELCFQFMEKLPKLRDLIEMDVEAAYDGDPAAFNTDEIIFCYPGLYAIMVNRIAHELHLLGIPLIPRIMTEYAHGLTGIDIHPGATIGRYFFIDHGTGIVIGETTTIGDRVKIYQGVTLGALSTHGGQSLRNKKRHPTIEDDVTIYSGASILGGETVIGKGATIGGNAFITSSIPAGARVTIKNQELSVHFEGSKKYHSMEVEQGDNW